MSKASIAIVAAMNDEIRPLLRNWRRSGRGVGLWALHGPASGALLPGAGAYVTKDAVVFRGNIGRRGAAMAAKAAVDFFSPSLVISAGFVGALQPDMSAGEVVRPAHVIDARSGQEFECSGIPGASGTLLTAASVLSQQDKAKLAEEYRATGPRWLDMEAAAVAEVAWAAGVPFAAVKAVSDTAEFEMPPMDRFIDSNGRLHLLQLLGWACVRPNAWPLLNVLRKNTRAAAESLATELEKIVVACR